MDLIVDFNIETIPNPSITPAMLMGQVKTGNIKDKDKMMVKQVEGAQKLWRDCATHPLDSWVFLVTVLREDQEEPKVLYNANEAEVLREFEAWTRDLVNELRPKNGRIAWHTFNGLDFDFRVVLLRAIRYKLPTLAREMRCHRYGDDNHVDWMYRLTGGRRGEERMKLDNFARFFGVDLPVISGGDILSHYQRPGGADWRAILEHTKSRVTYLRDFRKFWNEAYGPTNTDLPF